jgi:hypothetical protein
MRATYDEIVSTDNKRQHGIERIIGALLKARIAARQARSISYWHRPAAARLGAG